MQNCFLSGWRRHVLCAVAVSFALTSFPTALAAGPVETVVGTPQSTQGLQLQGQDVDNSPANRKQNGMYVRSNYVWPFATGPVYGSLVSDAFAQGVIRTQVGTMRLSELESRIPMALQTTDKLDELGMQYFIVDLDRNFIRQGGIDQVRNAVEASGGKVVATMPANAVVARLTSAGAAEVQSLGGINMMVPYQAAFKLHPSIGRAPLPNPVKAVSDVYDLEVSLWQGEDTRVVAQRVSALGGTVNSVTSNSLKVSINRAQLAAVASIQAVSSIQEDLPFVMMGEETTIAMQTGDDGSASNIKGPYHDAGINGSGNGVVGTSPQVLMVIDSGAQLDAADLSDTHNDPGVAGVGHRKVLGYETGYGYNGVGDGLGCDDPQQGGFSHGHVVSATALGNGTNIIDLSTGHDGSSSFAFDNSTIPVPYWVDGVAPGAKLAFLDTFQTPTATRCDDPQVAGLQVGTLYDGGTGGSLKTFYDTYDARVTNMSFGSSNTYNSLARQIDAFLVDHPDAMVFVSAGNSGQDADNDNIPDLASVTAPATAKNAMTIGASGNLSANTGTENREFFSSVGPASVDGGNPWATDPQGSFDRVMPHVMAPGGEQGGGNLGVASEFSCRTSDNDQIGMVECDTIQGIEGTSFSAPAAAGAAMLMRDYFAQGFYPNGKQTNGLGTNISGPLVKALAAASADYLQGNNTTKSNRFNNEQGYGRIQLDNVLPLESWSASATGLIVADGSIVGGPNNLGLAGAIDATAVVVQASTFQVCNPDEQLRVTLAWNDETNIGSDNGQLKNDLNLELQAPSGKIYFGNYFTDDDDRNNQIDGTTENCASIDGSGATPGSAILDSNHWSLPICTRADLSQSPRDIANNIEGIFLTTDYDGDGTEVETDADPADDDQLEAGEWTIRVRSAGTGLNPSQTYSVVVAGAACLGSSVRFDAGSYVCNAPATVSVNELEDLVNDAILDPSVISSRTTLEVIDSMGMTVDTESGLTFTQVAGTEIYASDELLLTDSTARDPGNGALDVRDGDTLRVTYQDFEGGVPSTTRVNEALVDCSLRIATGTIAFPQFGFDTATSKQGGCEVNARGLREFGFPDRYLDEGEVVVLSVAVASQENNTLDNVETTLRCVVADDALAPEDCRPGTSDCLNPDRLTTGANAMTACDPSWLTITNSPIIIGELPSNAALGINFNLVMGASIPDLQEVEFVLELVAPTSGKTGGATSVVRETLDADALATFYSTDFPAGGTQFDDINNNEFLENPTTNIGDFLKDYRFESRTFSDLTATNPNLQSPWNFDLSNGGFTNGIGAITDDAAIAQDPAQWGEDKNFNDLLDGFCSSGACIMSGARCVTDAQCGGSGGGTCVFTPQGWCGGNIGGTQCDAFDDPGDPDQNAEDCEGNGDGEQCVLVTCSDFASCQFSISMLVNPVPGPIACYSAEEDIDPVNQALDSNWGFGGGCGWQSAAPGSCSVTTAVSCDVDGDCPGAETCNTAAPAATGGMWHTGRIGNTTDATCLSLGNNPGQCQSIELVAGTTGQRTWFELLASPVMNKVDPTAEAVEITNWAWNQAVELPDSNVAWSWELDTDTTKINPADLFSDGVVLGSGFGAYSPLGDGTGNPDLTNGFTMFAPIVGVNGESINGSVGENRVGKNACYFEGAGTIGTGPLGNLGLAAPLDDDLNNGYCPGALNASCTAFCVGGADDGSRCNDIAGDSDCDAGDCTASDAIFNDCEGGATCVFDNMLVDEYVTANGPIRNMDVFAYNGLDLRFTTFEDVYGPTGDSWQAAIGMFNFEQASPTADPPGPAYGIGIDDMVVEWKEISLVPDATDCTTSGACATIDTSVGTAYQGNTLLNLTVLDTSPSNNDCDDNGDNTSGGDSTDCDGDGTADVRVTAKSENEIEGERINLNCVTAGATCPSGEYTGTLPISATYNSPGVLFVQDQGADNPVVQIDYFDYDDGTGNVCANSVDPAAQGLVQAFTPIALVGGNVLVTGISLADNGDNDPYADPNETVDMTITLANRTGIQLSNVTARLVTSDAKIDCVINPQINVGTMPADDPVTELVDEGAVTPGGAFTFRVANVTRMDQLENFTADLQVLISSDEFDTTVSPQSISLDLDLDVNGGGSPTEIVEGFEGGLGIFKIDNQDSVTVNADAMDDIIDGSGGNGGSFAASDGFRCQTHDPDWNQSNSYGQIADCYLAPSSNPTNADDIWWEISDFAVDAIHGRSYDGTKSMHYGRLVDVDDGYTTPLSTLEAAQLTVPVALGWRNVCSNNGLANCTTDAECGAGTCVSPSPRVTFKQQISLIDFRTVNTNLTADGGVLHIRLADPMGNAVGDWIKVESTSNGYDSQREDNYTNCMFDPIDDGTNEDDFDDPADPFRRTGPSSTCFPERVFTFIGDTDAPFSPNNLGQAQGPGIEALNGSVGTWIESEIDLARFRGRSVYVRMLVTSLKAGSAVEYNTLFDSANDPGDDGWFVDDFRIVDAIDSPATVSVDINDNSGLPACGVTCNTVTAALDSDPAGALAAPGQVIELDASASAADRCIGGTLQFQFWNDVNGNQGAFEPGTDALIRDWTDNALLLEAPTDTTNYAVSVRCSTDLACSSTAYNTVTVNCPSSGGGSGGIFPTIGATATKGTFTWTGSQDFAFAEGTLSTLSGAYATLTTGSSTGASHVTTSGGSIWLLLRSEGGAPTGPLCNEQGSGGPWTSGGVGEVGGDRDGGTLP
jgi:hypothetical protein